MKATQSRINAAPIAGIRPLLDLHEVAYLLNISEYQFREWLKLGLAPRGAKVGGHWKFKPEDVVAHIEAIFADAA
ncbi:helix-turn-helix transcriptional regulator [Arthrobacter sp. KK5.5]|uniref:helix-turn-helix transcriptional regulator n=1 Tax=Arthrobacter sp. KK5.5 TaxID=3373084 RepID=UPI003EE58C2A